MRAWWLCTTLVLASTIRLSTSISLNQTLANAIASNLINSTSTNATVTSSVNSSYAIVDGLSLTQITLIKTLLSTVANLSWVFSCSAEDLEKRSSITISKTKGTEISKEFECRVRSKELTDSIDKRVNWARKCIEAQGSIEMNTERIERIARDWQLTEYWIS